MKRAQAQQMLDEAYIERFKTLFDVLHIGAVAGTIEQAAGRFEAGVHMLNDTRGRAEQILEKIFPE